MKLFSSELWALCTMPNNTWLTGLSQLVFNPLQHPSHAVSAVSDSTVAESLDHGPKRQTTMPMIAISVAKRVVHSRRLHVQHDDDDDDEVYSCLLLLLLLDLEDLVVWTSSSSSKSSAPREDLFFLGEGVEAVVRSLGILVAA